MKNTQNSHSDHLVQIFNGIKWLIFIAGIVASFYFGIQLYLLPENPKFLNMTDEEFNRMAQTWYQEEQTGCELAGGQWENAAINNHEFHLCTKVDVNPTHKKFTEAIPNPTYDKIHNQEGFLFMATFGSVLFTLAMFTQTVPWWFKDLLEN